MTLFIKTGKKLKSFSGTIREEVEIGNRSEDVYENLCIIQKQKLVFLLLPVC